MSISQTERNMQRDIDRLTAALREILSTDYNEHKEEYGSAAPAYTLGVCKGIANVALRETGNDE